MRVGPASIRMPAPTIRLRLTLLYGLVFLVTGAVLLTIGYELVRHTGRRCEGSDLSRRGSDNPRPGSIPVPPARGSSRRSSPSCVVTSSTGC
jgi:hypothetical protein